jgi:hypothetical protein
VGVSWRSVAIDAVGAVFSGVPLYIVMPAMWAAHVPRTCTSKSPEQRRLCTAYCEYCTVRGTVLYCTTWQQHTCVVSTWRGGLVHLGLLDVVLCAHA